MEKQVFRLTSNGEERYYRTFEALLRDYVSQDEIFTLSVSDEEYNQFNFEKDNWDHTDPIEHLAICLRENNGIKEGIYKILRVYTKGNDVYVLTTAHNKAISLNNANFCFILNATPEIAEHFFQDTIPVE